MINESETSINTEKKEQIENANKQEPVNLAEGLSIDKYFTEVPGGGGILKLQDPVQGEGKTLQELHFTRLGWGHLKPLNIRLADLEEFEKIRFSEIADFIPAVAGVTGQSTVVLSNLSIPDAIRCVQVFFQCFVKQFKPKGK